MPQMLLIFQSHDKDERSTFLFLECWVHLSCKVNTYIFCAGSRNVNPGFGEEGTGTEHKNYVKNRMDRILKHVLKCLRWWQVVTETADWVWSSWSTTANILPITHQFNTFSLIWSRILHASYIFLWYVALKTGIMASCSKSAKLFCYTFIFCQNMATFNVMNNVLHSTCVKEWPQITYKIISIQYSF